MIKNIIWDFDGTLFDSYEVMTRALYLTLKEFNIEEDKKDIYVNLKNTLKYAVNHYMNKYKLDIYEDEVIKRFHDFERELYANGIKPMEHALDICKKVVCINGKNFLVTHREKYTSTILMDKYGFLPYFQECVTSNNNFLRKPSGEAFKYIVNKYKLNLEETLGIGDRDIDIIAAVEAGIKTCFISDGTVQCESKADYYVDSLEDIKDFIEI